MCLSWCFAWYEYSLMRGHGTYIDNAFIWESINSLEVRTPDVGTKPRSHAPMYLLRRASYLAQSLNKFRRNSSKWEYTYLLAEHISHLVSSHGSSVTYVCVSVKSAFVGTTKSTLELHNALYNSTQNILHAVAYPEIFFGGVQQIQLRTERTGIWGRQPPSQRFWRQL
jgi:hypothetical protein